MQTTPKNIRARTWRYVSDHGDLFRMSETLYRRYLLSGTREDGFPDAAKFGMYIGRVLTVNHLTPSDFSDLYKHEADLADALQRRTR